jgi:hypothetical protein
MRRGAVSFPFIDEDPPDRPVPIDPPDEHTTETDWCWCQPRIIEVLPAGRVIVHRREVDGPE